MKTLKHFLLISSLSFGSAITAQNNWSGSTVSTSTLGSAKVDKSIGIGVTPNNTYKLSMVTGTQYSRGIYINNNYSGNSTKYGIRSTLSGGTGVKYGIYSQVANAGKNARYGVYADAQGGNAWAGYFLGRGYFSDKVGIGVNTPSQPLHVKGFGLLDGLNSGLLLGKNTGATYGEIGIEYDNSTDPNPHVPGLNIFTPAGSNQGSTNFLLFVNEQGNIGMGVKPSKINNNFRLSVNGTIRATEIVVETGWADFVFEDDYKLKSLNEVEDFINKNGHLPEVPSAEEIQKNGASVGEIQTVLLQKIEELTLYTIEQQKKLDEISKTLEILENANH